MVVPETMDEELDIDMNPELMDDPIIAIGAQDDTKEVDGDTILDDELAENDYVTGSKDKSQDENYNSTKEEKRLVLEARHSLSIAETKKRRASVYSSESLFIPKELARSDVLHRRGSTLNTLERIAKHQEYCMRMLTFPVGSGRARYVAKQMKNGKRIIRKSTTNGNEEPKVNENLPRNMPELDIAGVETNQLQSDDEMSILIFDMVKDLMETKRQESKEKENTKLSENLQSQRTSVIKINRKLLAEEKDQHNVLFRWHNPNYCDGEMQMRLLNNLDDMTSIPETEVQVNFSELNNGKTTKTKALDYLQQQEQQQQEQQQQQQQQLPEENVNESQSSDDNQQQLPQNETRQQELEQFQIQIQPHIEIQIQPHTESQNPINVEQQTARINVAERQQQHVAHVPTIRNTAAASNNVTADALIRQQRMHQIGFNDNAYQLNVNNNNALNLSKRNSYASDALLHQWSPQSYPQQQQQHRQTPPLVYQQSQLEPINQLQELKAMHQRLKLQEDEQLNQIGNTLKKVYEERTIYERQHAEEKRLFMLKMSQNQKLEEKLQADREQLQRQHKANLSMLEQRIGEKQRQLLQQNLSWQRQQQTTYQQQLMMEQQHFLQQQQQQQQEQIQQQLMQNKQAQQQLLHQRFVQHQHERQQLAIQQHTRSQQQHNQQEHQTFYPSHGYDPHRQLPPPAYKPPPPPPYQAAAAAPPPPPPPPPPPSTYQQRVQSVRNEQQRSIETRQSIAIPSIEDQSRLIASSIHYHQPVQATMMEHSTLVTNQRSTENSTCRSSRTMRRRSTIDYRTLPYGLPSTQNVQINHNNSQRYPTEATASSGQVQDQNLNQTAITSVMQNYVSNFINDNLRPNG